MPGPMRRGGRPGHRYCRPALLGNERMLKVVGVLKIVGLHSVLFRPDGTYMDPADGQNHGTFDAMNNSWLKCYSDTGIAIVLS